MLTVQITITVRDTSNPNRMDELRGPVVPVEPPTTPQSAAIESLAKALAKSLPAP